jgi:plasmid stability protein
MKNVTVTLPDELATRARVAAARQDKSLSRYIADLLAERCAREEPSREEALAKLEEFLSGPGYPGISKVWKGRDALYAEREEELLHRYDASRLRKRPVKSAKAADRRGFAEDSRKGRYSGPKRTKPK